MLALGAINVLTSTYFLAVDKMPFIKGVFPTFEMYVLTAVLVAVPIVAATGYVHFKRLGAHSADVAVAFQNYIYNYRLPPGFNVEVFGPAYRMLLRATLKQACSEKLTDAEIREIDALRERLRHLIDGGTVGKHPRGVIDS